MKGWIIPMGILVRDDHVHSRNINSKLIFPSNGKEREERGERERERETFNRMRIHPHPLLPATKVICDTPIASP